MSETAIRKESQRMPRSCRIDDEDEGFEEVEAGRRRFCGIIMVGDVGGLTPFCSSTDTVVCSPAVLKPMTQEERFFCDTVRESSNFLVSPFIIDLRKAYGLVVRGLKWVAGLQWDGQVRAPKPQT